MTTPYAGFAGQFQIDAQYDPSLRVADAAAQLRHYVEQAASARQRLRSLLDVPYGPTRAETLDIFPADRADAPVFVFLHGGYWRALSSKDFSGVALGLQPLGITTVVVDYALCPQVGLDEIVRQARAAVAWVLRRIGEAGGDPGRVAIGGHSAGAQLAAMCLQTPWQRDYGLPQDPLCAALLVSGVYELEPLRWSWLQPLLQLDEGVVARNSPVRGARRCATPVWTAWGEAETEEFARQSQAWHAAWAAAGNFGMLSPLPGAHHYDAIHGFEQAASPLCRWLVDRLSGAARDRAA